MEKITITIPTDTTAIIVASAIVWYIIAALIIRNTKTIQKYVFNDDILITTLFVCSPIVLPIMAFTCIVSKLLIKDQKK